MSFQILIEVFFSYFTIIININLIHFACFHTSKKIQNKHHVINAKCFMMFILNQNLQDYKKF